MTYVQCSFNLDCGETGIPRRSTNPTRTYTHWQIWGKHPHAQRGHVLIDVWAIVSPWVASGR